MGTDRAGCVIGVDDEWGEALHPLVDGDVINVDATRSVNATVPFFDSRPDLQRPEWLSSSSFLGAG